VARNRVTVDPEKCFVIGAKNRRDLGSAIKAALVQIAEIVERFAFGRITY
jgi:hypothetical protein